MKYLQEPFGSFHQVGIRRLLPKTYGHSIKTELRATLIEKIYTNSYVNTI